MKSSYGGVWALLPCVMLSAACVLSIEPTLDPSETAVEPKLLGQWVLMTGGDRDRVVVSRGEAGRYDVRYTNVYGKSGQFRMQLGRLGEHQIVDLIPRCCPSSQEHASMSWRGVRAPARAARAVGGIVAAGGMFLWLAARLEFRSFRLTVETGVYRFSRHPQSLGWGLSLGGLAVAGRSGAALLLARCTGRAAG